MSEINEIRYRTEKIPPEGGWGYIVILGLAIALGCTWGNYYSLSIMFGDFVRDIGGETSSFTSIMGCVSISVSLSALFAGSISKMISVRKTAVIGAALVVTGNMLSVFSTSVMHLMVTYGLLYGVGVGLWIGTAFATFNNYFVKKRVLMMSIVQSIYGGILMVYPLLTQFTMNTYGFRGSLAIIAAINLHVVVGMIVMQPVEWHLKVIKVPVENETQPFINGGVTGNDVQITVTDVNSENTNGTLTELSDVEEKNHLEVINEETTLNSDSKPLDNHPHDKNKKLSLQTIEFIDRRISVVSITENTPNLQPEVTGKNWQKVVDILDLSLLKDVVYVNIISGMTFAHLADSYFTILLPMYLTELNISKDKTAFIMSLMAGFDLGARILLSIVSLFISINARYIYTAGAVACILSRFVFLSISEYSGIAVVAAFIGFLKTFVHVPTPLVIADYLPKERFVSGYGLYLFLQGLFIFLISPFIGWVRDVTNSYVICFHTLTFFMALCAVPWIIEIVWFRVHPREVKLNDNKSN